MLQAARQAGRAAGIELQHEAWRRAESEVASHLKQTHRERDTNALSGNQLNVTSHMNESPCLASKGPVPVPRVWATVTD